MLSKLADRVSRPRATKGARIQLTAEDADTWVAISGWEANPNGEVWEVTFFRRKVAVGDKLHPSNVSPFLEELDQLGPSDLRIKDGNWSCDLYRPVLVRDTDDYLCFMCLPERPKLDGNYDSSIE